MTTYNQTERNEHAEKAEFNSSIVQFYERCCASADVKRPWYTLHPQVQHNFTNAVAYMQQVIMNGG